MTDRRLAPGTSLPALEVGPLTLTDLVRWAGYQENWLRIHYDHTHAQERAGLAGCVQSGHHRTALLARVVTDWLAGDGRLMRLRVRHVAPVGPGEVIRCEGVVRRVAGTPGDALSVDVELRAVTQRGQRVSEGIATVAWWASASAPDDEAAPHESTRANR
jgi:acyl dehydratase